MVLHDSMADSITHLPNAPCFSPSLILPLVFLFDVFEWDLPVVGMISFLPNSHAESRALRWEYFKVGPFEGDQIMRAELSRIRMVSLEKGLQKLHFSYVKTQFKKKNWSFVTLKNLLWRMRLIADSQSTEPRSINFTATQIGKGRSQITLYKCFSQVLLIENPRLSYTDTWKVSSSHSEFIPISYLDIVQEEFDNIFYHREGKKNPP